MKSKTVDDHLATVSADRRRALEKLLKTIRSIIPGAVECISYGIPAFRLDGVVVAGFCATRQGCSYVPFSGTTLTTLARELGRFEMTKSSLHFELDAPWPATLVRKLIRARVAETRG